MARAEEERVELVSEIKESVKSKLDGFDEKLKEKQKKDQNKLLCQIQETEKKNTQKLEEKIKKMGDQMDNKIHSIMSDL